MEMKLNYQKVLNATVSVTATDGDFDYSANVTYSSVDDNRNIYDGNVTIAGQADPIATFSSYSPTNLSVNYYNADSRESEIVVAIKKFVEALRSDMPSFDLNE